jgi:hypothetical protein
MKVIMYLMLTLLITVSCGKQSSVLVNTHGDRITALEQRLKDLLSLEDAVQSIELRVSEIEDTLITLANSLQDLREAIESGEAESSVQIVSCVQGDGIRLSDGIVVVIEQIGNSSNYSLKALTVNQSNDCN